MPSRVKGPPPKCGLRLLILLANALPKQKPISFQSLELPVGLDFAMGVGFFFYDFPQTPQKHHWNLWEVLSVNQRAAGEQVCPPDVRLPHRSSGWHLRLEGHYLDGIIGRRSTNSRSQMAAMVDGSLKNITE